jgi:hypothetical protein
MSAGTGSAAGRVAGTWRGNVAVCGTGEALTVGCVPVPRLVFRPQAVINPAIATQLTIKNLFIMTYSFKAYSQE